MTSRNLKIVFLGSAEFAVPALDALVRAGYEVAAVVTQPDRARGRGGHTRPTPVGLYAETAGLKTLKPERLKGNDEFFEALYKAGPDLIVVAAYGKLLPKSLLEIPPLGCVNIHASLLPEYRGAAPVQRAILDGKRETGVTLIYMLEELDAGDIIADAKTDASNMNAGELTAALAGLGAALLIAELPKVADGTAKRIPQEAAKATYAEKIEKAEGELDFNRTAEDIVLRVRAMSPSPGAYIMKDGVRIGVTSAKALKHDSDEAPGTVLEVSKQGIKARAGEGAVLIEAIKMPGRKAMPVEEYLKGNSFNATSL